MGGDNRPLILFVLKEFVDFPFDKRFVLELEVEEDVDDDDVLGLLVLSFRLEAILIGIRMISGG